MNPLIFDNLYIIIGTILLACFVGYVNWRNAYKSRIATHKTAFRAAFNPELSTLRELNIKEWGVVFDILVAAYPQHETAYLTLHRELGFVGKWLLRRRWMAYRGTYQKYPKLSSEDKRYRLAHFIGSDLEDEENKRLAAIKAIGKLIA